MEADRLKYPGMLPDEILVLRAWLTLHQTEYDSFDYNVRIGAGTDPGPAYSPEVRKQAVMNTQLRLDVVAYKHEFPTIIEVKRRAGPSNVGQLLTYDAVWRNDYKTLPAPKLMLLCADYSPHILPAVQNTGIDLQLVQVDFSGLAVPKR
jgi:hypothetical protein